MFDVCSDYLCCLYCCSVGVTADGDLGGYSPHVFCSGETWTFLIEEGTCVTDCSAFSLEKEVCPS